MDELTCHFDLALEAFPYLPRSSGSLYLIPLLWHYYLETRALRWSGMFYAQS